MGKSMKSKLYNLIVYCDTDFIQEVLDSKQKQIEYYAYIYHDRDTYTKDVYDDAGNIKHGVGELKVPHSHVVLMLKSWRYVKDIKSWFIQKDDNGVDTNVLYKDAKGTIADCLKYLNHSNAPDKVQYDKSEIHSYNIDWEDIAKYDDADAPVDNCYDIIQDMLSGVDVMTMIKRYGRDFVYHFNSFVQLRDLVYKREERSKVLSGEEFDYEKYKYEEHQKNVNFIRKVSEEPYYPEVLDDEFEYPFSDEELDKMLEVNKYNKNI